MRRIISNEQGELDNSKVFWLVFWLIFLATTLCINSHMSSIARSLRIMSAVNGTQPTIVVPAQVLPSSGTVTLPLPAK